MEKIIRNKLFVIVTPIINFVLFIVAGIFLGYEANVVGFSYVSTTYQFSIRGALGVWLIGLAVSLLVFLICVLLQKVFSSCSKEQ